MEQQRRPQQQQQQQRDELVKQVQRQPPKRPTTSSRRKQTTKIHVFPPSPSCHSWWPLRAGFFKIRQARWPNPPHRNARFKKKKKEQNGDGEHRSNYLPHAQGGQIYRVSWNLEEIY